MALPEEIIEKINERIMPSVSNCPLCNNDVFHLNDNLYGHSILDPETKAPMEGGFFPVILISCKNCYYTFSFSAKRSGIID